MFERLTLPDMPLVSPYCHAVRAGDFLFVTGQLAQDPQTGTIVPGPIADQTRQVMENLKRVLDYAGGSFDRVTMARIFLTDIRFIQTVNETYASFFPPGALPSRTTIGVTGLAGMGDIEIDLIVYCGS